MYFVRGKGPRYIEVWQNPTPRAFLVILLWSSYISSLSQKEKWVCVCLESLRVTPHLYIFSGYHTTPGRFECVQHRIVYAVK